MVMLHIAPCLAEDYGIRLKNLAKFKTIRIQTTAFRQYSRPEDGGLPPNEDRSPEAEENVNLSILMQNPFFRQKQPEG
jgi:hypothetical protein